MHYTFFYSPTVGWFIFLNDNCYLSFVFQRTLRVVIFELEGQRSKFMISEDKLGQFSCNEHGMYNTVTIILVRVNLTISNLQEVNCQFHFLNSLLYSWYLASSCTCNEGPWFLCYFIAISL